MIINLSPWNYCNDEEARRNPNASTIVLIMIINKQKGNPRKTKKLETGTKLRKLRNSEQNSETTLQ